MEIYNVIISDFVVPVLAIVLSTLAGYIGIKVKTYFNKKIEQIDTEEKRKIVDTIVKSTEQLYTDFTSDEKLEKAIEAAAEICEEKGLKISALELRTLIEATVNGFNQSK